MPFARKGIVVVFEGRRWTYSRLNDRVNQLANSLLQRGVGKGDSVGLLHVNCHQYIETYFASAKIGAVFVPLNFRAKADELAYMIGHAEVKVLFVGDRYMDLVNAIRPQLSTVRDCISLEGRGKPHYEELDRHGSFRGGLLRYRRRRYHDSHVHIRARPESRKAFL